MYRVMPKTDRLPHALYRAEQVRALDRAVIEDFGIPGEVLMARAGAAAFALLRDHWPEAHDITVLAGVGNNAGDGFVLARLALEAGLTVRVLQLGDREKLAGDARLNAGRYQDAGGDWRPCDELPSRTDVIVDGIFGTGLSREVSGAWAAVIQAINRHPAPVLALDIPSGLQADTGVALGVAVQAAVTLSFIGLKQGMFTADGPDCCGEVFFDALAVPARVYARQILSARRLDWAKQREFLAPRPRTAHKGDFGHVLVVGGNHGMGGAARLAAEAALRAGAGLVSLATRTEHVGAVLAARPEIMVHGIDEPGQLDDLITRCSVIAIGPGLGRDAWGRALWQRVLDADRPLVVDADALNLLAEAPVRRHNWILTPHPGEAARLLAQETAGIGRDRFVAVAALVARYGGVAVLKGAGSLVQGEGERPPAVCCDGNPGMASGGMGDVLTGVVGGMIAQGFELEQAAAMAVCLHGAAGDAAAARGGERGLLASDLLPELHHLVNPDD